MSSAEYDYVGQNFVIEKNVLKGASMALDLPSSGAAAAGVPETLLERLGTDPGHVAQIDAETGRVTTWAEMREKIVRCALWLRKKGVAQGDTIAVCTHSHLEDYVPCFAAFLLGAVFNPWHHEVTLETARYLMTLARPRAVFVCESAAGTLAEAARLEGLEPAAFVVFEDGAGASSLRAALEAQTPEEVERFEPAVVQGRDVGLMLFSSGTTGRPKGVELPSEVVLRLIHAADSPVARKNLLVLWYSSLYWISGSFLLVQTLTNATTRVVHSAPADLEDTCRVIERLKVNLCFFAPGMITHLGKSNLLKTYKLDSMKVMINGGAKMSRQVLLDLKSDLPHVTFTSGFGMTETGGYVTLQTPSCKMVESAGFVAANCQLKVVDVDSGESLGPNRPGEVCVKTPSLMIGYRGNPEATESAIDEEGWLHTGDVAYYTEEGEIMIVDRIKEVMKFRGHQVSPSELEEVLLRHPAVMEVAVVPVPHETDIERPMAFVKKVPGAQVSEQELVDMTSKLGEFKKLWGGVEFLDKLPYTATGKVGRKDLKEMAKNLNNRSGVGTGD